MKKKALYSLYLICLLFFISCSSSKKTTTTGSNNATTTGQSVANNDRDGSSLEKAIIIKSKTDLGAVDEEYAWLKKNYPGYKTQRQALIHRDKKSYDKITVVTADGETKDFYFDITNGFGKF